MKQLIHHNRTLLVLACLASVLLLCAACGGSSITTSAKHTNPSQTITQASYPTSLPAGPITYVALGASDAVGVGSDRPGSQGYVPLLATRLLKGSHLVNLGISGERLHSALTQELPLALSIGPNLITIWLVANDFVGGVNHDTYMSDLNTLLQQIRANTHAFVVMANLPNLTLLPAFANETAKQKAGMLVGIKQWNRDIASIAARYGVTLVDLFSHQSQLTAHPEYISGDGFHPSPAGYVQLAGFFWKAIAG